MAGDDTHLRGRRWRAPLGGSVAGLPVLAACALVAGLLQAPVAPAARPRLGAGTAWFRFGDRAVLADGATARVVGRADLPERSGGGIVWPAGPAGAVLDEVGQDVVVLHGSGGSWRASSFERGVVLGRDSVVRSTDAGAWIVSARARQARYLEVAGARPRYPGPAVTLPPDTAADQVAAGADGTLWVAAGGGLHAFGSDGRTRFTGVAVAGRARLVLAGDAPVLVDTVGIRPFSTAGEAGERVGGWAVTPARVLGGDDGVVTVDPGGTVRWLDLTGSVVATAETGVGPDEVWEEPALLGGRVYVPVRPARVEGGAVATYPVQVLVVDRSAGGRPARRLGPLPGPLDLFAHDGHVWWIGPVSNRAPDGLAGVIADDLTVRALTGALDGDDGPVGAEEAGGGRGGPRRSEDEGAPPVPSAGAPAREAPVCPRNAPEATCPPVAEAARGPAGPSAIDHGVPCPANAGRWACAPSGGGRDGGSTADAPPTFSWDPPSPRTGQDVTFTAALPPGAGAVRWTFPGGAPRESEAVRPVVRWSAPATYDVTLEVATPDGAVRRTRAVPVSGPGEVVVPELVGQHEDEARRRLVAAGLVPGTAVTRPSVEPAGTVLEARTPAGPLPTDARLPPGSRVDLVVSDQRAPIALATGTSHTCAVLADGTVRCWGGNLGGQLGDGTTVHRFRPVTVAGVTGATAVAAGTEHTCALVTGGRVRCWGSDRQGQLGDGPDIGPLEAREVTSLRNAVAITAGGYWTCALLLGGDVWCWGGNFFGQLGDGTTEDSPVPVRTGVNGATAIDAGDTTCAIVAGGQVSCWGMGTDPAGGNGPAPVPDVSGATALQVGPLSGCALVGGGTVRCWVSSAMLGGVAGSPIESVPGVSGATILADTASAMGCAIVAGGAVRCWWKYAWPEGFPARMEPNLPLNPVEAGATAVVVAFDHGCAIIGVDVRCWGSNQRGQLGNGGDATLVVTTPVPVALHEPVR